MDTIVAASWAGPFNRQYSGLDLWGIPIIFPHMIRLMGNMISGLEKRLRKLFPEKPRFAGTCLTLIMCLFWLIMPGLLFHITGRYLGLTARFILESFSVISFWLQKCLCVESMKVCKELKKGRYRRSQKGSFHDRRP